MLGSPKIYSKNAINKIFVSLVAYLILPISALAISFTFYKKSWSKYLFMLFGLYFGFSFIIPSSKTTDAYDSEFYAMELKQYHLNDVSFTQFVHGLYNVETAQTDVYQPLVTWVVSIFTDNSHVLFGVFGLIFSFFLAKIIWLMFEMGNLKLKGFAIYLLLTLILINPLWNINGVRMWTALNVFLYGVLLFYFKDKGKGILFILLSCLFHVSFIIPIIFLVLSLLVSRMDNKYFFMLFLLSFLLNGLPPSLLNDLNAFLPDFVSAKLSFYTDPDTVSLVAENTKNTSFFILASQFSQYFIVFIIVVYLQFFYKKEIVKNKKNLLFYNYLLFTVFWVNMSSVIPSFGRFQSIYLILSLFFLFVNLSHLKKLPYFKALQFILFLFFSIIIVQRLRDFMDFQGIYLFVGNFFTYFFVPEPEPLINFL